MDTRIQKKLFCFGLSLVLSVFCACTSHSPDSSGGFTGQGEIENPGAAVGAPAPGIHGTGYSGILKIKISRVAVSTTTTANGVSTSVITLYGENFADNASVMINSSLCSSPSLLSSGAMSCTISGVVSQVESVTITAPDRETGHYSMWAQPTIPPQPPQITGISPNQGPISGNTLITINGLNFATGITVNIGQQPCSNLSVISANQLTCRTPSGTGQNLSVTVLSADGSSATRLSAYVYVAPPTITSVIPNSGSTAGGTIITISGTGFSSGASVSLGGSSCFLGTVSTNQIQCTTSAHAAASVNLTVTNPDTQSDISTNAFTYIVPTTPDSWTNTNSASAPTGRVGHVAIWTGAKMIVWGGQDGGSYDTGGVYDPATDAWSPTNMVQAPAARYSFSAVWTGSKMIVWGGSSGGASQFNDGGSYDPAIDSWTPISTVQSPSVRSNHTAIWTGNKMIVWGGVRNPGTPLNTGGIYDPSLDSWTPTDTSNAPLARYIHTAVWTGNKMIVWGGSAGNPTYVDTGGIYDPNANTWLSTSTASPPAARYSHSAIWTGSKMIIWGGKNTVDLSSGALLDPNSNSWSPTSLSSAPAARQRHTAVWTGSSMIIWGGYDSNMGTYFNSGGLYNPLTNSWTATNAGTAPEARSDATAIWTGSKMIVWGGYNMLSATRYLKSGGIYNP